jgi:hypothetical protein
MGLFTKSAARGSGNLAATGIGCLDTGRRLRSSNAPQESARVLAQVFGGYRAQKYPELPPLVPSGVRWLGDQGSPAIALSGMDESGDFILLTLAPGPGGGTDAGIFPLGSGPGRLSMSLVGHWKTRDSSLSSVGQWPARTAALTVPPINDRLISDTLAAAGYPASPANLRRMAGVYLDQFLVKSYQFIEGTQGQGVAKRFIDDQRRRADFTELTGPLRMTLQALANWNSGVLPYVQDLPYRAKGVLLDVARANPGAGIWADMQAAAR